MVHLLDSSVLIALFADHDVQHVKARRLVDELQEGFVVPYCVIQETASVLTYKYTREQSNKFVQFMLEVDGITVLTDNALEEMQYYLTIDAKVSFADAALVHLATKHKMKLHTFDKQLARLAKKLRTP